jgi:hypothetical protein
MSLAFALMAAINGSTGSSATLSFGLYGTKPRRRHPSGNKILTAPRLRARFDQLRTAGIVERNPGVYQASHIALYSSCRLPAPPIPALTGELTAETPPAKHPGRIMPSTRISTDKRSGFHKWV